MKFEIVKAVESEIDDLIAIRHRAWLEAYPNEGIGVTTEFLEDHLSHEASQRDYWGKYLNDPESSVWVARVDGKVIGLCHVSKSPQKHEVERIYVNAEFQKQGIGLGLMKVAEEWLGLEKPIRLTVVSYNPAIRFYEKLGYRYTRDVLEDGDKTPTGDLFYDIEMIKSVS